jgi:hypothetical protein
MRIKNFNQFKNNESILGAFAVTTVAGLAIKWWINSLYHDSLIEKYLAKIQNALTINNKLEVTESENLFLINVGDQVLTIDKDEKKLFLVSKGNKNDSRKTDSRNYIKLSNNDYYKFVDIIAK